MKRVLSLIILLAVILLGNSPPPGIGRVRGEGWGLVILGQPQKCYGCVTELDGYATWFRAPWKESKTLGLLAHNYLGGRWFYTLGVGDEVRVVDPQGVERVYRVVETVRFVAVRPGRADTEVRDEAGRRWTQGEVYARVYERPGGLTLQTSVGGVYGGWWFVLGEEVGR